MSTLTRIPSHLKKYVVDQNYARYTSEDQAVWRFIMRQLKDFLSMHAHECYVDGLKKTGIDVEKIPSIQHMDEMLARFGWGAVPVSGFIPPAAFMEFQSLGILPIASDMRTIQHLQYTPAPDIVHEAAGHAPILVEPAFANYLRKYADVARRAIVHREDLDQYSAIRQLSDVKEDPGSTRQDIERAEKSLTEVNSRIQQISEAGWLSRMNWWTAEYGLIGPLEKPKIFGAGLLSSVGESRHCLSAKVKKIPLSVECIDVGYDITEPQPQLFVTPDFDRLHDVLEDLAKRMAFRLGGTTALERARKARTITTTQLDSGLQISGELAVVRNSSQRQEQAAFLKWQGPVQLSCNDAQLPGQGPQNHPEGFSTPLGRWQGTSHPHALSTDSELSQLGLNPGKPFSVKYESGVHLQGRFEAALRQRGRLMLLRFSQCELRWGDEILYRPEWGPFDLAVGTSVASVFGGPADRASFGETDDFAVRRVPPRRLSSEQESLDRFLLQIRDLRAKIAARESSAPHADWLHLGNLYFQRFSRQWLPAIELIELTYLMSGDEQDLNHLRLVDHVRAMNDLDAMSQECIADGLKLADIRL